MLNLKILIVKRLSKVTSLTKVTSHQTIRSAEITL